KRGCARLTTHCCDRRPPIVSTPPRSRPMRSTRTWLSSLAVLLCAAAPVAALEPVTLDNVVEPDPNRADEPLAREFSMDQGLHFLDSASLYWQQSWGCFTCHTNISYLIARPTVSADAPAHRSVRKFA